MLWVSQSLVWIPLLLLLMEFKIDEDGGFARFFFSFSSCEDNGVDVEERDIEMDLANSLPPPSPEDNGVVDEERYDIETDLADSSPPPPPPPPLEDNGVADEKRSLIRVVLMKLATNRNVYANVLGFVWALLASRFKFNMPSIMEGSIEILPKAGAGTAMFDIGMFIAMQDELTACGIKPAVFAMVSRFVIGLATMALCSLAVGLHGPALRFAIIQAAIPQAITSFVFANKYGLRAKVLNTALIAEIVDHLPSKDTVVEFVEVPKNL